MYYLGIDFGTKKLGIALLETTSGIASPLPIIKNDTTLFEQLERIIASYRINTVLLGLPSYESTIKKVMQFSQELEKRFQIKIILVTEDNSSLVVKKGLQGKKQKQQLDSYSAVAICEQWYSDNINAV